MILNRFAISALSRKYKNEALPEEIMIHKETGQVLIKTNDGDIISYDSLARLKNHIDMVTLSCYNLLLSGELCSLELDTVELPEVINENTNLLSEPLLVKVDNLNKLLISVDMDCVEVSETSGLVPYEPMVRIDLMFKKQDDERVVTTKLQLNQSNTNVIRPQEYFPLAINALEYHTFITGIYISRNSDAAPIQLRNILHSIIVVKE